MPKLKPTHECTVIPQEICQLKFTSPREEAKPFMSKWCIDPNAEVVPDQTYDESDAEGEPLGPDSQDDSAATPQTLYGAPGGAFEEEAFDIPPPPEDEQAFEQAASSYDEPVTAPLAQNYGGPQSAASPNALYDAPPRSSGGPRRNGGQRRNGAGGNGRRRGNTH